jgi:hypothetical protein
MSQASEVLAHEQCGQIVTIRNDGLPFDALDLGNLLEHLDPRELPRIGDARAVGHIAGSNLLLRWNHSRDGLGSSHPAHLFGLLPYLQCADKEFARLEALGLPLLNRNVLAVEQDPYSQEATTYTVVPHYGTGEKLSHVRPRPQDRLIRLADILIRYYDTSDDQLVLRNLGPQQCAPDLTQYDYDPLLDTHGASGKKRNLPTLNGG